MPVALPYMKLFWSVVLLLFLFLPSFSKASDFSGRVIAILDGDTIEVLRNRTTERVRLVGIDCPEKKQPFGQRAKQATSSLSFGRNVTVHSAGKDRYGRTLGTVELTDSTNLNHELVRQGWCWWYWKYAPEDIFLAILEAGARDAKKGLWVDPAPVPPWEWRKRGKRLQLIQ
jgi:micrococcal nuclease